MFLPVVSDPLYAITFITIALFLLAYSFYVLITRQRKGGMIALLFVPILLIARQVIFLIGFREEILTILITGIDCCMALLYVVWFTSTYGQYSVVIFFSVYTGLLVGGQILFLVLANQNVLTRFQAALAVVPIIFLFITHGRAVRNGHQLIKRIQLWFFFSVIGAVIFGFTNPIVENVIQELICGILLLGYFTPLFFLERGTYRQVQDTIVLQNNTISRLFEDLRQISSESIAISTSEDEGRKNIDNILDSLIQSIVGAINPDGVIILLLDRFNENLEVRVIYGVFPPVVEVPSRILRSHVGAVEMYVKSIPIKPGETFLGKVFSEREPLYLRFLTTEQQTELFANTSMRHTMNSVLAFPLFFGDRTFGVLSMTRNVSKTPFTPSDYSQAELLARYTSLVIDNRNSYIEVLEKQQIEQEIGIAADIQTSLLPAKGMISSDIADIEVFSKPLKGVSGDYFDMVEIPDTNTLAVLVCDVAGKGIPASLLMVLIRTVFHTAVKSLKLHEAGKILTEINTSVNEAASIDRFATMLLLLFTKKSDKKIELNFANAGHHPLMVAVHDAENVVQTMELDNDGIPIGVDADFRYTDKRFILQEQDIVALYTDGISEIRKGSSNEEYGIERLEKMLHKSREENIELPAIKQRLLDDMTTFAEDSRQHDDQTLVLLKMKDNSP